MLWVLLESINKHHRDDNTSIIYNDISSHEIKILKETYPNYDFIHDPFFIVSTNVYKRIPLKLRYWIKACHLYTNEFLCLVDCDMALSSAISEYVNTEHDIIYTWKDADYPLNTGVILCESNEKNLKFMDLWNEKTEAIVEDHALLDKAVATYGAADQYALAEILNKKIYNDVIEVELDNFLLKFKGVECKYLNETRCVPITEETHIIHFKAGWHPILLLNEPFTFNRPKESCKEMFLYWYRLYSTALRNSMKKVFLINALKHKDNPIIENYEAKGALISKKELVLLYSIIHDLDIKMILSSESGILEELKIISESFPELKILQMNEMVKGVKELKGKDIGVILNILNNPRAIEDFKHIIKKNSNIIIGFISSSENIDRNIFSDFQRVFITNNTEYINNFPSQNKSSGPSMAVILPTLKERIADSTQMTFYEIFSKLYTLFKDKITLIMRKLLGTEYYNLLNHKIKSVLRK